MTADLADGVVMAELAGAVVMAELADSVVTAAWPSWQATCVCHIGALRCPP